MSKKVIIITDIARRANFISQKYNRMSYDPSCSEKSNQISCQRQTELAKIQADQETTKLRYMLQYPACSRMTQLADRGKEHCLMLGRKGNYLNNAFCRVLPQVSILDFPNNMCEINTQSKECQK